MLAKRVKDQQTYLADGGYGFLIGDGRLNYGRENIVATNYIAHVWRGIYVAPGLQHIVDPGYNRDRGPVLVPSFRLGVLKAIPRMPDESKTRLQL